MPACLPDPTCCRYPKALQWRGSSSEQRFLERLGLTGVSRQARQLEARLEAAASERRANRPSLRLQALSRPPSGAGTCVSYALAVERCQIRTHGFQNSLTASRPSYRLQAPSSPASCAGGLRVIRSGGRISPDEAAWVLEQSHSQPSQPQTAGPLSPCFLCGHVRVIRSCGRMLPDTAAWVGEQFHC